MPTSLTTAAEVVPSPHSHTPVWTSWGSGSVNVVSISTVVLIVTGIAAPLIASITGAVFGGGTGEKTANGEKESLRPQITWAAVSRLLVIRVQMPSTSW